MTKVFNVTADCKPDKHYMVDLTSRIQKIKTMIDNGEYFTINRARQYGKTTTLRILSQYLKKDYYVVLMDFQTFGNAKFKNENTFSISFASSFLRLLKRNSLTLTEELNDSISQLKKIIDERRSDFELKELFEELSNICDASNKKIVLMIDEVDSATNNQIFLDFLAQLRAYYIDSDMQPTFHSVILASVYDIKNLKKKFRSDEEHKTNSPWNIASNFNIDMLFSENEIATMLRQYEANYHTGMDVNEMSKLIYDYTSGYPFLVSKLCKLIDEIISSDLYFNSKTKAWSKNGFYEAVKIILSEKNTLFESLIEKLISYSELNSLIERLLFTGKSIVYNTDNSAIDNATMFGFIKNQHGTVTIANRIFEMRLYNFYLSTSKMQSEDIYKASLQDKNQFIMNGHLNMKLVLEKFVIHFNELYGDSNQTFLEEEGRKYFLLYLRPIINGTGNYYIESRTRDLRRTDVIVDYQGEQYIIEMKIWHSDEYNSRGEKQLVGYLDDYHQKKRYMVSFNFNKNKKISVYEIVVKDKILVEAIV